MNRLIAATEYADLAFQNIVASTARQLEKAASFNTRHKVGTTSSNGEV